MKSLLMLAVSLVLCLQGCTRNDRDSAGLQRQPGVPATEATAEPPRSANEQSSVPDPAANGGLGLRAAAPYASTGSSVSQNVNPGPFVQAAQAQAGTAAGIPPANMLTRNADGTMSGPFDLPPASTGWGTAPTSYGAPAASAPRASKKAASPPRK